MIAATELALVNALKQAGEDGQLGYTYRVHETFPDQFEEYLNENPNLRTPACWATFLGLLDGRDDGDGLGFRPVARTDQMKRQRVAMVAIECELVMPLGSFQEEAGDFERLHLDWDVPPHGNVQAPLPALTADARDDIEMPA